MRRAAALLPLCALLWGTAPPDDRAVESRVLEIRREYGLVNGDKTLRRDSLEIVGESAEGAMLYYYSDSKGGLRKLEARYYGEMGQIEADYYLKDGRLFFALVREHRFNRPIYWTREYAREFNDQEAFDANKSKITEDRYYFDKSERMVRWIDADKRAHHGEKSLKARQDEVLGDCRREKGRIK